MANTFNHNDKVVITDGGSVGIGKTSSISAPLNVFNSSSTTIAVFENNANFIELKLGDSSNTNYTNMVFYSNSGNAQIWKTGSGYTGYGGASSLNIYNSNGAIAFHPNATTNAMFINNSGNVGIGTTSPASRLHVNTGTGTGTANTVIIDRAGATDYSGVSFATAGTVDWSIGHNSAGNFEVFEDGLDATTRLTIQTGGNVGIGESSPNTPLYVQGGAAGTGGWNRTATLSATYPALIFNSNATKWGGMAYDYSTAMRFWVNASSNDIFAGTLAMSILNNGNVGIGITNPADKLEVVGNISIGSSYKLYNGSASDSAGITFPSSTTRIDGFYGITFHASSTNVGSQSERMRITAAGNVGIGTTSPEARLHIQETNAGSSGGMLYLKNNTESSGTYTGIYFGTWGRKSGIFHKQGSYGGYGTGDLIFATNSTLDGTVVSPSDARMVITNPGNVGIGTTSPASKLHVAQSTGTVNELYITQQKTYGAGTGTSERAALVLGISESGIAFSDRKFAVIETGPEGESTSANSFLGISTRVGGGISERMRITSGGNVGIGTTSPSEKLHVYGTSSNIRLTNSNWKNGTGTQGGPHISFHLGGNSSEQSYAHARIQSIDRYTTGGAFHGALAFLTSSAGTLGEKMRIEYNGNVGINNTSPQDFLHVRSGIGWGARITYTGDDSYLRFSSNQIAAYNSSNNGSDLYFNHNISGNILFSGSGNVGIGTTSPDYRLTVEDAIRVKTGIKLTENTSTLYATDGALSYYSTANGVYLNGAGTNGWLRLNAAGTENYQNCIDIYGGAAGAYVVFRTNNSERMRITSGGNVGIGTDSPIQPLTVSAVANASTIALLGRALDNATRIDFYNNGGDSRLYTVASGNGAVEHYAEANIPMVFSTNATERMRITSGGNVGIGTTSPGSTLTVVGSNTGSVPLLDLTASGSGTWQRGVRLLNTGMSAGDSIMMAVGNRDNSKNMGQFYFYYAGNASNSNRISMGLHSVDDVFNILGTGNVGIGTTTPGVKLDVAGTSRSDLHIFRSNQSAPTADAFIFRPADNTVALGTANAERMRIDSSGNVGIGTTSPAYKLDVSGGAIAIRGNAAGNSLRFDDTTATSRNAMYVDTSNYLNVGNANYAGLKLYHTASQTPSTGGFAGENIAEAFGSTDNGRVLAEPSAWLEVRVGTTDYVIPMFATG